MRIINKPNDDPKSVYLTCISGVLDKDLKDRLESVADHVAGAAGQYDNNGINHTFYRQNENGDVIRTVTQDEMDKVYTSRMVGKTSPGRCFYDKLKASAPHSICPLCGHRTVTTLDHYLPKANYPSLVVVPFNLVPSCSDCNKLKIDKVPTTAKEQTLHPYYDNVTAVRWLFAKVIEEIPASFTFFVKVNEDCNVTLKARIQRHFDTFKLAPLYTSQAGTELANIRFQLNNILSKSSASDVRRHLEDGFNSRYRNHINSWQTAMYEAMAKSDWFCNGGFNYI